MVVVGLEAHGRARCKGGVGAAAAERRSRGNDGAVSETGRAAEPGRSTIDQRLTEHSRATLVVGVAAAERSAELFRELIAEIAEYCPGLGVDIGLGGGGESGCQGVQAHVECGQGVGV